jgi:CDP-diglyceride synthetase
MDNSLTPEKQNALIENALHTYPVTPLPRDITADVMTRIKTIPAPRSFHLTWEDFILAIIFSVCIGAIWFSMNNLPPLLVAQIRKESILLYQYVLVNMRWLFPVLFFGLAAFLSALTIPYLGQELRK